MHVRRAIVVSHGPSARVVSKLVAACHAFTNVCWVASSASSFDASMLRATAYTSRPYSRYT